MFAGSISYTLLRIKEPKTRFRAARHQAGKMETTGSDFCRAAGICEAEKQ